MNQTQTWTVGRLLEWTTDYLRQHGSDTPRLDAEVLLAHARQCQRIQLYTSFAEEPDEKTRAAFREMVRRRAEGTPVAYLVGHKEFYSLDLIVTPDVLIPRNETEHLVMEALDCAKRLAISDRPLHIADICTGSGCVAIAIAKHLPQSQVFATDISPEALAIAKRNVEKHSLNERIHLEIADLFGAGQSPQHAIQFDLVVSNPPYVSLSEFEQLAKSVKEHEPRLALVADEDGLSVIRRLITASESRVQANGFLLFEFSPMLASRFEQEIASNPAWKLERIAKDLAGHPRIAILRKS